MNVTTSIASVIFFVVIAGVFSWIMYMWGRKRGFDDGYKYGQSSEFSLGRNTKLTSDAISDIRGKILIEVPSDRKGELWEIEDELLDLGVVFETGAFTRQIEQGEPCFVREWLIDGVNQKNIRFEVTNVQTIYED